MVLNKYLLIAILSVTMCTNEIRSAASSGPSQKTHVSPYEYYDGAQQRLNIDILSSGMRNNELQCLLEAHVTELPSLDKAIQHIEEIKRRHESWCTKFSRTVNHLQYPDNFKPIRYPSRMVYFGPSGCGKTYTALALAKVCKMECLLIHCSSIETTYRQSGSTFLEKLFSTLQAHPERKFLVILDELKSLAQFSKDEKNTSQHTTVIKFWQCLDAIEKQQHICIVGTDNTDPKDYEPQIRTRLFNNTFKFNKTIAAAVTRIITMDLPLIEQSLSPIDSSSMQQTEEEEDNIPETSSDKPLKKDSKKKHRIAPSWAISRSFSDVEIDTYAASLAHLSDREIRELKRAAIEIAITEKLMTISSDSTRNITLNLEHLKEAWRDHQRSLLQRIIHSAFIQRCISPEAIFTYGLIGGSALRIYGHIKKDEKCKRMGEITILLGGAYHQLSKSNDSASLIPIAEGALHLFNHIENRAQFADSRDREIARKVTDDERYKQQRADRTEDYDREAIRKETDDERYEQQRADRTEDCGRDLKRYAQSRIDRDDDRGFQIGQATTNIGFSILSRMSS